MYLAFMKALYVDLFSRRHQFSSILASSAASRMVSPRAIFWCCVCCPRTLLGLYLLGVPSAIILVVRSRKTLSQDMGDHPILHWGWPSWDFIIHPQHSPTFFSFSIRRLVPIFSLLSFPECLCIIFELFLCGAFIFSCIVTFFSTIVSGDMVKFYLGGLFILFCFTFVIPNFTTLYKHKLVVDTLILEFPIRVIIRLVI